MQAKSMALKVPGLDSSLLQGTCLCPYKNAIYTKLNMTAENLLYFDVWGLGRSDRHQMPRAVTDRENDIRKEWFPKISFIRIKSFQNKMLSLQSNSVRTKRNCPIRTKRCICVARGCTRCTCTPRAERKNLGPNLQGKVVSAPQGRARVHF